MNLGLWVGRPSALNIKPMHVTHLKERPKYVKWAYLYIYVIVDLSKTFYELHYHFAGQCNILIDITTTYILRMKCHILDMFLDLVECIRGEVEIRLEPGDPL